MFLAILFGILFYGHSLSAKEAVHVQKKPESTSTSAGATPTSPKVTTAARPQAASNPSGGGGGGGGAPPPMKLVIPITPPVPPLRFTPVFSAGPRPGPAPSRPVRLAQAPVPIPARPASPLEKAPTFGKGPSSEIKVGGTAQLYLGFFNDMRDLAVLITNTKAMHEATLEGAKILADLHQRNTTLLQRNAMTREDWERSLLNRDLARASAASYEAAVMAFTARQAERELQREFLTAETVDIDKLYSLYRKEWEAQCLAADRDVEAVEAQLRMATFEANMLERLNQRNFASYYDLAYAKKDLIAVKADLAAKKAMAEGCPKNWPTKE